MDIILYLNAAGTGILVLLVIHLLITSQRYKSLVDHTGDIVFLLRLKPVKRFLYISQSVLRFCGYSREYFYTNPDTFTKLTHPADYPLLEYLTDYPLDNSGPVIMRWITQKGKTIWIELQVTRLRRRKRQPVIIQGVIRNISYQKEEELSLRETSRVFKNLFNNATDCIILYQYTDDAVSGRILVVNNSATNLLQYSVSTIREQPFKAMLEPERRQVVIRTLKRLKDNGKLTFETLLISSRGESISVEINFSITYYRKQKVILAIARNISIRKKMESELLKHQKLESVGLLAGGLAHDFNNLLSVMLGNIDFALTLKEEDKRFKEILGDTRKAINKATDLTNQLLTFAKGGLPIKKTGSISDLLKETAIFDLRGVNIRYDFHIPADLWTVEFDEGQLNQVFNNLIINARQAMPRGGNLEIRAENILLKEDKHPLLNTGRYIKISMRDSGTGIKKVHLDKIFDPFFSTRENGSGLGLALSYSIIKKHGGLMTVDSVPGKGTTFYIYLPATDTAPALPKAEKTESYKKGNERILVMDDEKMLMKTLHRMLTFLGYRMDFCVTGEETIRQYKQAMDEGDPYALVIMDLTIQGGMGGEQTLEELRHLTPEVQAIVSSGYSHHPVMAQHKDYGFMNVIRKPYTINELSEVLAQTLESAHQGKTPLNGT